MPIHTACRWMFRERRHTLVAMVIMLVGFVAACSTPERATAPAAVSSTLTPTTVAASASTTGQPTSTTNPPTSTVNRRGQWPPPVPQCASAPFRFLVPVGWQASIPRPSDTACISSSLSQSLLAPDQPVDGLPGFFYAGTHETDAYPVSVGATGVAPDVTGYVEALIRIYMGQTRHVVLSEAGVTIDTPLDGLDLRRVTNAAGVVALRVRFVLRVQSEFGGAPAIGDTMTYIAFAQRDGTVRASAASVQQASAR
ncbi:MAG: hypothetical protein E6G39_08670 [Actinobacteria bacterium]|nr:MAG: hypothetical protein E6G39_08670 [Actinomycetota bacterium]